MLILVSTAWLTQAGLWELKDDARYLCYFFVAWLAAKLRVRRRSSADSTSMIFLFLVIALVELNLVETVLIAGCAIVLEAMSRRSHPDRAIEMLAGLASMAPAALASHWVYHSSVTHAWNIEWPVRLVAAAAACFLAANGTHMAVTALVEPLSRERLTRSLCLFSLPYYLLAASVTALYSNIYPFLDWYTVAALIPMVYLLHRSYSLYTGRIEEHRAAAAQTSALHLRTIEALAIAIDKDEASEDHVRRIQLYAVEIGRSLGMKRADLEGLRAAAVLHDIGNLAVPENIATKPGRLTPEEFDKIKTHAAIGASILDRVKFPYPVAAIVRAHHERWDGSGYPHGLKGEQIPLGARILAVVDCLDALASKRRHRSALSVDEAITYISDRAGSHFDPRVVRILKRRYRGFERTLAGAGPRSPFLETMGAARDESIALMELHDHLAKALTLDDVGEALRTSLRTLIPYDALIVTGSADADAQPELICGDRSTVRRHSSKLTLDLPGPDGVMGSISLYSLLNNRFTPDHLRLLRGLVSRIGQAVDNGKRYQLTSQSATTDYLTRLPNAKALFEHLERDIDNARSTGGEVVALVCDLNGFKEINDTLGHLAGNEVLREVAQSLRQYTRDYDYVARLGGDEFVLVFPAMSGARLEERVAELRTIVREAGLRACQRGTLDASFGAARFPADGLHAHDVIAEADRRMYADKAVRKGVARRAAAAAVISPPEWPLRSALPWPGTDL